MENITVVGIGKLGLGFALLLERSGYNVLGIDIFQDYVDKLNSKSICFTEPEYDGLLQNSANFRASTDLNEGISHSNIIFIIVQTPNGGGTKFYDHTILSNLLEKISRLQPSNKQFIIGCTIMPNYINEIAIPLMESCKNCSVSYNPEFIAQGDIVRGFENPDIILVGTTDEFLKPQLIEIYSRMVKNTPQFHFMTPLDAEIVKISLNGFITTKISFANMISDLCDEIGGDKHRVLKAIGSDTRIGCKYFNPGLSFGGPCFPRDTKALKQLMDQNGIYSQLLQSTTEYNEEHNCRYAAALVSNDDVIRKTAQKATGCIINGSEYMFTGVCYKEGSKIPLIEESAKLKIAEILVKQYQKKVIIQDTESIIREVKKEYGSIFSYVL
jgi:nucleotide sugar dehydrogenase